MVENWQYVAQEVTEETRGTALDHELVNAFRLNPGGKTHQQALCYMVLSVECGTHNSTFKLKISSWPFLGKINFYVDPK